MPIRKSFGGVLTLTRNFVLTFIPFLLLGHTVISVQERGGFWFDTPLLQLIYRTSGPQTDWYITRLTLLAGAMALPGFFAAVAAIGLLFNVRNAAFFAASLSGAWALNVIAKLYFQRTRPSLWLSPLPEHDFSFPSGHAMGSMAMAAALVLMAWPTRLRWPALISAMPCVIAIGLSRLYLGVHYPSDILAGWCCSLLWVLAAYRCTFMSSQKS